VLLEEVKAALNKPGGGGRLPIHDALYAGAGLAEVRRGSV
jgi:hypothetical protein